MLVLSFDGTAALCIARETKVDMIAAGIDGNTLPDKHVALAISYKYTLQQTFRPVHIGNTTKAGRHTSETCERTNFDKYVSPAAVCYSQVHLAERHTVNKQQMHLMLEEVGLSLIQNLILLRWFLLQY